MVGLDSLDPEFYQGNLTGALYIEMLAAMLGEYLDDLDTVATIKIVTTCALNKSI